MKTFDVDVSWTVVGSMQVQAETKEEAWGIAETKTVAAFNGEYLSGSFELNGVEEVEDESGVFDIISSETDTEG